MVSWKCLCLFALTIVIVLTFLSARCARTVVEFTRSERNKFRLICIFILFIFLFSRSKTMSPTTNYSRIFGLSLVSALLMLISVHLSYSCNEQVCASIVSKCMLTQSCKCDLKNCSCCSECFKCLSHLSTECCSCVGEVHHCRI